MSSPSDRYGSRPAWQRALGFGIAGALVLAGLVWLGWVAWFHSTPEVTSELLTWEVVDDHTATARVQVDIEDVDEAARIRCVVQAQALDHTTVGEVTFTPSQGTNEVPVRTERAATSVSLEGCTAPGQNRPR